MSTILRLKGTANYLGLSLATLNRKAKNDPTFPAKIRLSSRCCGYRESELADWLDEQKEKSDV